MSTPQIATSELAVDRQVRLFRPAVHQIALRLAAAAFATGVLVHATPVLAQSTPATDTAGSGYLAARQFAGIAGQDNVLVRAGPGVGEFAVASLRSGAEVTVVARQGSFLRILPPPGTFCLVPKSRVNVRGDANEGPRIGRASENLNVRVGSLLGDDVGRTTARMQTNDVVRVTGEQGHYYRIDPPKSVFFYVPVSEMRKGRELIVTETGAGWSVAEVPAIVEQAAEAVAAPEPLVIETPEPIEAVDEPAEVTPEASDAIDAIDEKLPTEIELPEVSELSDEKPAILERFESIDALYQEQAELPLSEQPLEQLQADYTLLLEDARAAEIGMGKELAPIIEARIKTIQIRRDALADLEAIRELREGVEERRLALEAEREELVERVELGKIELYEAVGELQPSSLQVSDGTLFRLVDPETKRTLIYLRARGELTPKLAGRLQRFIGVRGAVAKDTLLKLKYIDVKHMDLVKPSDVFGPVAAKLVPPSMVRVQDEEVATISE